MKRITALLAVGALAVLFAMVASAQRGDGPGLGERGERVIPRGSLTDFAGDWEGVLMVTGISETARQAGIEEGAELPMRLVIRGFNVSIFFPGAEPGEWGQFGPEFRIEQSGRTGYVVALFQSEENTETWTFNLAPAYYEENMMVYMSRIINVDPPFAIGGYGQFTEVGGERGD